MILISANVPWPQILYLDVPSRFSFTMYMRDIQLFSFHLEEVPNSMFHFVLMSSFLLL